MTSRQGLIADAIAIASERLGGYAAGVLARLAGPLGHVKPESKRQRSEKLAALRAPIPPGLRSVHPSWIEAALDELPERARAAVATGSGDRVDVWLARWATAGIPPMSDTFGLAQLVAIGADQLAYALGTRAASIAALADAASRIAKPPRLGNLGPQRAALARCAGIDGHDELALLRIAARALAPHLATDQLARLAMIRRLPVPLGLVVERELHAHAAASLDQGPTWAALAAAK